jgi:hypothetical protein
VLKKAVRASDTENGRGRIRSKRQGVGFLIAETRSDVGEKTKMGSIIAAFIGGVFIGGIICGLAGLGLGYITANKHNLAAGTALLPHVAATQVKQQPQSKRVTSNPN